MTTTRLRASCAERAVRRGRRVASPRSSHPDCADPKFVDRKALAENSRQGNGAKLGWSPTRALRD